VGFVAKSSSVYVVKVDVSIENQLRDGLLERGFVLTQPPYTLFAGKKKGVSCTLYQSGKLVVQGKDMGEFIEFYLEPEVLKVFEYGKVAAAVKAIEGQDMTPHIGVDEAGKGDFLDRCALEAYSLERGRWKDCRSWECAIVKDCPIR
jgi:ribonuclease HIII